MLTSDEVFTGGVYGFLQSFGKMVRETQATSVIVCKDSKPYRRSLVYPEYKLLRKKNQDDRLAELYRESEPLVIDLLNLMGVPIWAEPGFESDDLIGSLVTRHRSRWDQIIAASNDSDLWQLFWCDKFFTYKDNLKLMMHGEKLMKDHGLSPDEYMLMTALMGTHNDIAGIHGVGPKTAVKIIRDPGLLRHYKASHKDLIERNLDLIKLPHADLPRDLIMPRRVKAGSSRDLYRWAARYEIDVTLQMVNAFEQINRG